MYFIKTRGKKLISILSKFSTDGPTDGRTSEWVIASWRRNKKLFDNVVFVVFIAVVSRQRRFNQFWRAQSGKRQYPLSRVGGNVSLRFFSLELEVKERNAHRVKNQVSSLHFICRPLLKQQNVNRNSGRRTKARRTDSDEKTGAAPVCRNRVSFFRLSLIFLDFRNFFRRKKWFLLFEIWTFWTKKVKELLLPSMF